MKQPFYNVYAFCRTADDVADESSNPQEALEGLQWMQSAIDSVYQHRTPQVGLFPALSDTIDQFGLSKRHFDDLISAFRQDQHQSRYASMADLLGYCRGSANPVGRLVLELANSLNPETEPLSDSICTGLQLANFWQDVARDYAMGRVYLPQDACERHGVEETMLLQKATTPTPVRSLLKELCDQAEQCFQEGLPLVQRVPKWLAADIRLFANGGLETLKAIRDIDYDVLRIRPTVSKRKQFVLVTKALFGR